MFADTFTAPEKPEHFKLNWLSTFKKIVSERFSNRTALSTDHLSESHYRDLGLSKHRRDAAADIRPVIILGPM